MFVCTWREKGTFGLRFEKMVERRRKVMERKLENRLATMMFDVSEHPEILGFAFQSTAFLQQDILCEMLTTRHNLP